MKINIAVDGYSACGKSTLARQLAQEIDYIYIDSGAMYRTITLYFLSQKINIKNLDEVNAALERIQLKYQKNENGHYLLLLNGEDVSSLIRGMEVSDAVSPVAAIKEVRTFAVAQQRAMGINKGVVMDGRDVGTVVFPDAELKIFLTADVAVRAERRHLELKEKGDEVSMEEVMKNIEERDYLDTTRVESPLKQAADARVLDNSNLNKEEQLEVAVQWFHEVMEKVKA